MNRQWHIIRPLLITLLLTIMFITGLLEPNQRISVTQAQGPVEFLQLQSKAQSQGTVRVIVELNLPTELLGQMTFQAAQNQQLQLSNIQTAVVQQLAGQNVNEIARFDYIPFVALEVDADALAELVALPQVASITEDRQMTFSLTSSLPTIEVDDLHAAGFTGVGQTVAIIDSGVSKTHSAFGNRVVSEACYSTTYAPLNTVSTCPGGVAASTASGSGIDCTAAANALGLTNAASVCSHGTHVAGIAAGNMGIAKDADIIAIQVASLVTNTDNITIFNTDTLLGLQRVLALHNSGNYNVAAVNLSLGGGQYFSACDGNDPATKAAFDNLRSVGIAPIVATGNNGFTTSMSYPACLSSGISVGATADHDQIVDFSNIASFIDLLAPGYDVVAAVPGNATALKSGTSMATPMVAGVWTALKEAVPNASVDDILAALKSTGTPVDDNTRYNVSPLGDAGGGTQDIPRINANQALNKLKVDIAVSQAVTPLMAGPGDTITYTLAFTNSGANTASTVYLTDILPGEITGESYQANGVSVSSIGGGSNYVWQVDNLAPDASGSLIVTGQVASGAAIGSNISNVFTTATTLYDTDAGNDSASASFSVCGNSLSVSNANDSGSGSLRQAIADACDGATITFTSDQTISLNSTLAIDKDLTINGSGKNVTISGNNSVRVFDVAANKTVTFSNFTIMNGLTTGNGGGILNAGNLTLKAMLIRNNNASGGGQGGGIYSSGSLTVKNSTFTANTASGNGGGLFSTASATLQNSTFSQNQGAAGGGIAVGGGTLTLSNSLIADSLDGGDCAVSGGAVTDNGHNLVEDGSCITAGTSLSGDPLLAGLSDYGGDTQTLALLPTSPAIDAGHTATCEASDQRGESRVNACDIGAFESQGFDLAATGGNQQSTVIQTNFTAPLTVTITANNGVEPVGSGIQLDFAAPTTGASLSSSNFTATLNSSGIATASITANSEMGSYVISATAISQVVTFTLTNDCASGLTVSNANPTGLGSLDHAVNNSCANSTIGFTGDYTIYLDKQLTIDRDLTIDGSGQTIILSGDSNNNHSRDVRPFHIASGAAVTLRALSIISGTTADIGGGAIRNDGVLTVAQVTIHDNYAAADGGGIYNAGSLLLDAVSLRENIAVNSGGGLYTSSTGETTLIDSAILQNKSDAHGGGLSNASGKMTVQRSLIRQNQTANSGTGGGIRNWNGQLTVLDSTISGNNGYQGGGISQLGGTITLTNVTVVSNTTREGVFPDGGGIYRTSGVATILNSIFAYHGGDNCFGSLTSAGYNLEDADTCTFVNTGDQVNTNPHLTPLGNYGGQTETHALTLSSPALNTANNSACSHTDQRGLARFATCDKGAFESQGFYLTIGGGDVQTATVSTAFSHPLQVTAVASDTNLAVGSGHPITFSGPGSGASLLPMTVTVTTDSAGQASATVTANNTAGSYQVLATANGSSNTISFSLINDGPNMPPVLAAIGNQTITETLTLSFSAAATDVDPEDTLSYSLISAPTGANIHPTSGLFSWTPTEAQGPDDYTFEVVVSDDGTPIESDRETIVVTVVELNTNPILDSIGNRNGNEGHAITFTATATDADVPAQSLSYSLAGAPSGATIDSSSGLFGWTPTESQGPGNYTFDVIVSDDHTPAGTDRETMTVSVGELNIAPVLDAIDAKTITATHPLNFSVIATDADDPAQSLSYSLADAPSGATIDRHSGLFSWTPSKAQGEATYSVAVIVSDDGSPVLSDTQTVLIQVLPVPTYTLTLHTAGPGSGQVSLDPAGHSYDENTIITLTATADSGFYFGGWSGDLANADTTATLSMDDHKVVTATFNLEPVTVYTLTINTVGNGSVNLASGNYISGTTLSLNVTPDADWQFEAWSGDLSGDTTPANITMNRSKTITATFSQLPSAVVVDLSIGVTATASQVNAGDFVSYAISFANTSPNLATNLVISNVIPSGISVTQVANSGSATVNHIGTINQVERFEIASLAPGESGLIAMVAQVQTPHPSGYFTATLIIESENSDSNLLNNTASTAIVVRNSGPVIHPIANRLIEQRHPLTLTATASDPNGETVTFSLVDPPTGAVIASDTGQFSWTPTQPGHTEITIMVEDDGTPPQSASTRFMIRVKERVTTLDPTTETTTTFPISDGVTLAISVPVGSIDQSIVLDYEPLPTATTNPADFSFAGVAFDLNAYIGNQAQANFIFVEPVIFTLTYRDEDMAGLNEAALQLYHFDEATGTWQTDGITVLERDSANNQLIISVAHLTTFALFSTPDDDDDPGHKGYLPVVIK